MTARQQLTIGLFIWLAFMAGLLTGIATETRRGEHTKCHWDLS